MKDLSIGDLSKSLSGTKLSLKESLRLQEKRRKLALRKTKPTVDTGVIQCVYTLLWFLKGGKFW